MVSRISSLPIEQLSDGSEFLTVADAARLLGMSPSTVWRWVDRGRLPATRIGPKAIRIRRADLDGVVRGTAEDTRRGKRMMDTIYTSVDEIKPLTAEERRQAKAAIERAGALARRIRIANGGELFSESADIIREAREERSRQL